MLTSRLWMGILIFIIIIGTASITTFTVQRSGCLNPIQKWLPSRYPYQPTGPNIDTTSPAQAITSTSIESSTRTSCPSELPPAGPTNRPPVDIFVMVLSGPPFPQRRDAIRQTWAQHLVKYNISTTPRDPNAMTFQYRFFMGRDRTYSANETCADERKKYNDDIVVIPTLVDEYFTMTAKRQRAIAWIMKYYAPKYIIKIDDDTYLNVPLLMKKYRDDKWSTERFYMGYMFDSNMPVLRNIPGHRNAETDLDPALTKYPKFASGAGYVLSGDVGQYLATPPLRTRENSPNEDAILGLAFLYFDIEYRHENDIHAYPMKDGECRNPQQMLIQHYTPPKGMGEIHTCVEKNTEVCRRGW